MIRHDVGCVTPLGDDAVNAIGGLDVLAQQTNTHLGHGDGIGGVDAILRKRRSMSGFAVIVHIEMAHREAVHPVRFAGRRVHHHGGMNTVEHAGVEHHDLAAAPFFGGGSKYRDGDPEVVRQCRQCQPRPHRRRCDDVVPAGMTDSRQGVVLGADADVQWPAASGGSECGGQPSHAGGDGEAGVVAQRLSHPCRRSFFLVGQFRVTVQLMAEGHQRV